MVLREACKLYETHARDRLRRRTFSNRRSLFRALCALLGDVELTTIDDATLDAYVGRRLELVKAVSVNSELRAYRALLHWLEQERKIAVGARPHQLRERPPFRVRSWTHAEVRRLLAAIAAEAPRFRPIVFLLLHTGLRCGEALNLRWDCIDVPRRLILVWPSDEWTTKSGRPREVPIGDELLAELRSWARRSEWVFPAPTGRPYARWPQRYFDRARKAAGLRGGPHTCRHTYATEFLAKGGTLAMLAQILGHSDQKTTRLYAHLRPDHLKEARNLVSFAPSLLERLRATATRARLALRKLLDRTAGLWIH